MLVKTGSNTSEVKLTDVGVGVSQVLPALIQAFYTPPGSVVWMEQPEIHLHPQVQSRLADVMISAVQSNQKDRPRQIQLVIESHSEHFLNRLQRRVAEGAIKPGDVAIYFCREGKDSPNLEELKLDEDGNITNWPDNFFGDEMEDALARTKAAMDRRSSRL